MSLNHLHLPVTTRRVGGAALIALLTAGLAACSGSDGSMGGMDHSSMTAAPVNTPAGVSASVDPGKAAGGPHNAADVRFAAEMIPHHQQAVAMAALATSGKAGSKVRALAGGVAQAQTPEISTMAGWLLGWKQAIPTAAAGHDMAGMMSAQQMADLGAAKGDAFDRMWLTMMIQHHRGAIATAKAELADGVNPAARKLAEAVVADQGAEITTMQKLLDG